MAALNNDLVSIITPTFIAETIESVLAQTYQNWEMLIVDDCSTDDTAQVVAQYEDPRIKHYCLARNSGAAVARNTALRMAKGRWIAFLDSDDLWKPEKLERQIAFMTENNYAFSYHEYSEVDEDGVSIGVHVSGPKRINRLGMISYCWPGCLTVMYDRNVVEGLEIPDIKKNNDYAMWLIAIKRADCYLLKDDLAQYRKRCGSISNTNYLTLIKWHYRLFKTVESCSKFVASILTLNNLFWGIFKKIAFVKRD